MDFDYSKTFEPASQKEIDAQNEAIIKTAEDIQRTVDLAHACIKDEKFVNYKRQLEKAQLHIIEDMIGYTKRHFNNIGGDLQTYGANMARYITRIEDLRMLLKKVEFDGRSK